LGTGNGGAAIWARKRLEQLDHEVHEGEANVTVQFAWLVAAQRRQRRATELSGSGDKTEKEEEEK
jgi:hypothetical protein